MSRFAMIRVPSEKAASCSDSEKGRDFTPCAIGAVMIHVADVEVAVHWYQQAFPLARRIAVESSEFQCLDVGPTILEIVPADGKVSSGAAGSVAYWRVADFSAALSHMQEIGATLYRGPLAIENGEYMCQVRDPWGNCIGLRGPTSAQGLGVARAS
jgi:predicted enzyme related to lactoylglutathione lyase